MPRKQVCSWEMIFANNLPLEGREAECKSIYANEMVKLTVQIADPYVMVIEKDVSATFSDMLGIVGMFVLIFSLLVHHPP